MNNNQNIVKHWWEKSPWRLVQTNMREIDMKDINAQRFVSDLLSFNANVAMISTSGIVANYKTKLPYHFYNPYINGDDIKDVIKACKKAGIRVIARMDFSKVRRAVYEKNPEWAFVTNDGGIIDYNGDVHVCFNGEYRQELSLEIMKETIEELDVDGFFFNFEGYTNNFDYSGNRYGICQCDSCKKRFKDMYGEDLPTNAEKDPVRLEKFEEFKKRTLAEHEAIVHEFLTGIKEDICIANHKDFDSGFVRNEAGNMFSLGFKTNWPYLATEKTKIVKSAYPNMIASTATVDFVDIAYRYVAVSPYLQEHRIVQSMANGGGLDYYMVGRLDDHEDKSGYELIKGVFAFNAQNEEDYMGLESAAQIALIYDERTTPNMSRVSKSDMHGWFRFLTENHFIFDLISNEKATPEILAKYKAVVLPDKLPAWDSLAKDIDSYVESGGTLISSFESGFVIDEISGSDIAPRFQSLGIKSFKSIEKDMRGACIKFESKDGFPRMKETDLAFIYGEYAYCEYQKSAKKYMKLIPPHPFGPPEKCYYTVLTDDPGYTVNRYGKGKGVYIPWCPGEMFDYIGEVNTFNFISDLLENFLGIKPISGNISNMVEVAVLKSEDDSYELMHLINGTCFFANTCYEPIDIYGSDVKFESERKPKSIKSLVNNTEYEFNYQNKKIEFKIEKLSSFDAIKISY